MNSRQLKRVLAYFAFAAFILTSGFAESMQLNKLQMRIDISGSTKSETDAFQFEVFDYAHKELQLSVQLKSDEEGAKHDQFWWVLGEKETQNKQSLQIHRISNKQFLIIVYTREEATTTEASKCEEIISKLKESALRHYEAEEIEIGPGPNLISRSNLRIPTKRFRQRAQALAV